MLYKIKDNELWYKDKNTYNTFNEKTEMKQCNEYAALYDMSGTGDLHTKDNPSIYCDFYKNGKYLYSLKRNGYRPSHEMFLEFFEKDNKTVFMFNLYHGQITIHNADTGEIIGYDKQDDKFLTYWSLSNDKKFMYLQGWWWNPIDFEAIYKIEDLLNVKDYHPHFIDYDYEEFDFNKKTNKIIVLKKDKSEYEMEEFFKLYKNGDFEDL